MFSLNTFKAASFSNKCGEQIDEQIISENTIMLNIIFVCFYSMYLIVLKVKNFFLK